MSDDFAAQAEKDFAPAWMAEVGDKIVGKVTQISEGWSDQSESYYPIVTIYNEHTDKEEAVHAFWIALQRELMKWKPAIGERIAIVRKDDKPNKIKGRKPIKIYRVQIEGRSVNVWDRVAQSQKQPERAIIPPDQDTDTPDDEDTPF